MNEVYEREVISRTQKTFLIHYELSLLIKFIVDKLDILIRLIQEGKLLGLKMKSYCQ